MTEPANDKAYKDVVKQLKPNQTNENQALHTAINLIVDVIAQYYTSLTARGMSEESALSLSKDLQVKLLEKF